MDIAAMCLSQFSLYALLLISYYWPSMISCRWNMVVSHHICWHSLLYNSNIVITRHSIYLVFITLFTPLLPYLGSYHFVSIIIDLSWLLSPYSNVIILSLGLIISLYWLLPYIYWLFSPMILLNASYALMLMSWFEIRFSMTAFYVGVPYSLYHPWLWNTVLYHWHDWNLVFLLLAHCLDFGILMGLYCGFIKLRLCLWYCSMLSFCREGAEQSSVLSI